MRCRSCSARIAVSILLVFVSGSVLLLACVRHNRIAREELAPHPSREAHGFVSFLSEASSTDDEEGILHSRRSLSHGRKHGDALVKFLDVVLITGGAGYIGSQL